MVLAFPSTLGLIMNHDFEACGKYSSVISIKGIIAICVDSHSNGVTLGGTF